MENETSFQDAAVIFPAMTVHSIMNAYTPWNVIQNLDFVCR